MKLECKLRSQQSLLFIVNIFSILGCQEAFSCRDLNGSFNPLSVNHTKWSNILKQFAGILPTNCLSVFDHFVGLALKELHKIMFAGTFLTSTIINHILLRSSFLKKQYPSHFFISFSPVLGSPLEDSAKEESA